MVRCPMGLGKFEFAILAGLRATQLSKGCAPRVTRGHNTAATAQMEVAQGKVRAAMAPAIPAGIGRI
jgi:DNA-directed RNA polymerase subunit K/omega